MSTVVPATTLGLRERVRRSLAPAVAIRSAVVASLTIVTAPLLAIVALYFVGLVVGDNLLSTGAQLVTHALLVNVLLFAIAGGAVSLGTLAIMSVHADAHAGVTGALLRSFPRAFTAFPRLVVAQAALIVSMLLALLLWFVTPVIALLVALALHVRNRRALDTTGERAAGVRAALLLAIPFAPVVFAAAMAVTAFPAALSRPQSVPALVRQSHARVRTQKRGLALLVVLTTALSAAFTAIGSQVELIGGAAAESVSTELVLSSGVLAALFCVLIAVTGAAFAVLLPPTGLRMSTAVGNDARAMQRAGGILRRIGSRSASVAIVTAVALVATLVPGEGFAQPAAAATLPIVQSSTESPAAEPETGEAPAPAIDEAAVPAATDEAAVPVATDEAAVPAATAEAAEPAATTEAAVPAPTATAPELARPADRIGGATEAAAIGYPTALAVQLSGQGRIGDTQFLSMGVSAPDAPVAEVTSGVVNLFLDDLHPMTADVKIADFTYANGTWGYGFATTALPAGDVSLRFEYQPGAGYLASQTTVVHFFDKATVLRTSQTLTPEGTEFRYREDHTLTLEFASPLDGALELELYNASGSYSRVLTQPFSIVDGAATVTVDLSRLAPGAKNLVWEVPESDRHGGAASETPEFTVLAIPTTLELNAPAQLVHSRTQLLATITTDDGTVVDGGAVTFFANGVKQAEVPVYAGVAGWHHTPDQIAEKVVWRAEYHHPVANQPGSSAGFESSFASKTVDVGGLSLSTPVATWSGDLTQQNTSVSLAYVTRAGLPAPTGTVSITDYAGNILGQGVLVDGVVSTAVAVAYGTHVYKVNFPGDTTWMPTTTFLPFTTASYQPVVTLTGPASSTVDASVALSVSVTGVPAGFLAGVEIFRTFPNGETYSAGVVQLGGGASGSLFLTEYVPGAFDYVARATFTPSSGVADSSSAPLHVEWSDPLAPQLTLTIDSDGKAVAGDSIPAIVTAATLEGGGAGIPSGTEVTLYSLGQFLRTEIGKVRLTATQGGLRGATTITRPLGGTELIIAAVTYGSQSRQAESAPVTLTVAPPPGAMSLALSNFVLGERGTIDVTVEATGVERHNAEVGFARLTVNGVGQVVHLTRSEPTAPLRGRASVLINRAGGWDISASATGDGVRIGDVAADASAQVAKQTSTVKLSLRGTKAASGEPLSVFAWVTSGGSIFTPAPEGPITITAWPSGLSCTVTDGRCDFPAGSVVTGRNDFDASYAGDTNHLGDDDRLTVDAQPRLATLAWQSSPADWVSGEKTTFRWTVSMTGVLAPAGRVEVRYGSAQCSAPVAANECQLTIPLPISGFTTEPLQGSIAFIPADDAPGVRHQFSHLPKDCFIVSVRDGYLTEESARACERNGRAGYATGSRLVAHHNAVASPNVFDSWNLDGANASSSDELPFTVSRNHVIGFVTRYEPTCFTLTLDPYSDDWKRDGVRERLKGSVAYLTVPNCSHPTNPTASDKAERQAGKARFAAGTVVRVLVSPIAGQPEYTIDTVVGGTPLTDDGLARSIVMDADKAITATFKVRQCNTLVIPPLDGGTIRVTAAARPASSSQLSPADGSCTINDKPGWVPGTELVLTATPNEGLFFDSWRVGMFSPDMALDDVLLTRKIIGDAPKEAKFRAPNSMTYTMPASGTGVPRIDARFSEVRCVAVTIESQWPVGSLQYEPFTYRNLAGGSDTVDDLRCGQRRTTTELLSTSDLYETRRQTDWFAGSALIAPVAASENAPFATNHQTGKPADVGHHAGKVSWSVDNIFAVQKEGVSTAGPELNLALAGTGITVKADWWNAFCRPIYLINPQGGDVQMRTIGYSVCADGEAVTGQPIGLLARPIDGTPIVPIFSTEDHRFTADRLPEFVPSVDGRRYWAAAGRELLIDYLPGLELRVEYCVPIQLTTEVKNRSGGFDDFSFPANGGLTEIGAGSAGEVIADDGGCPPLYARPGQTVQTGLTAWGAYGHRVLNSATEKGPQFAIDSRGQMRPATMQLEAICFSVPLPDRVSTRTASNCPHDGSKYTRGTILQLEVDVHAGETFHGWSGADKNEGDYAWVIVDRDRAVTVDIGKPSTGQKILNVLSSVAQRVVSGLVTIATGMLLAHMAIVKGIALTMAGASAGLRALGVSGRDMNRLDRATAVVSAQTKSFELFAGCVGSWAHGPKITSIGGSDAVADGGSAAATLAAKKLQAYLIARGHMRAGSAAGAAGNIGYIVDAVTAFGSSHDMYFQNARDSWSRLGTSLGSCMEDGLKSTMDPVING